MKLFCRFYYYLLCLRYDITVSGLEHVDPKKNFLIFPNHEALVDPQIVTAILGQKIRVSPVMSETFYRIFGLNFFFKMLGAIPMGDIQRWGDEKDVEQALADIKIGMHSKKNILIYPSGQLYSQGFEVIKWKKTAFEIVKNAPASTEILTICTSGLWGSMWSKAESGKTPNLLICFFRAWWYILANFIFFLPKRKVTLHIENRTSDLKNITDMNAFNQNLEDWYNAHGPEEVNYKKHYFYRNDTKNKTLPKIQWSVEVSGIFDAKRIAEDVKTAVFQKVADIKSVDPKTLTFETHLVLDLYCDSLDVAEIKSAVQALFKNSSNPPITDIKTLGDLCNMVIWLSSNAEKIPDCLWMQDEKDATYIKDILTKSQEKHGKYFSIPVAYGEIFSRRQDEYFLYDTMLGTQSKRDFHQKVYILSSVIAKIPGKYIGVMLPSLGMTSMILMATYKAGKIPVMLNWTLWETALTHCVQFANISSILTAKSFYAKIENDGTQKLADSFLFLEDILKDIPFGKKLQTLLFSRFVRMPKIHEDEEAVLLFTSGSESLPKAVSLSHKNILSDILGALAYFPIQKSDILIGFLPPFHSFGFTINTILPLISGMKIAYTPDPNDPRTIATLIEKTGATTLTATPTFLKMILVNSTKYELSTLKYAVVGAEKCPPEVMDAFREKVPDGVIVEWYGITECSPVISINPPQKTKEGSVGVPIAGGEVQILSLENAEKWESKKEGMIYFSGPNVFGGYLDADIESPFLEKDGKTRYKTGDLGYLDDDGYIFITGRLKRFVKIAGEMISLPFVEEILSKKYATQDNRIALEAKEKDGNVRMILFSQLPLDTDEINAFLRTAWVSNLVKIHETIELQEIPLLGTGKTDYKVLKEKIIF